MRYGIQLKFKPCEGEKLPNSYFLGAPVLPKGTGEEISDDEMFLGVIHLPDIAAIDIDNLLPHQGYLYFFLDTSGTSRHLVPIVRYSIVEPSVMIDDFNKKIEDEEFHDITKSFAVSFEACEADAEGCKLLGVPCDWNYPTPPKDPLLLTISHFDEVLDFLPELDGYTYVFFGPEGARFDGAYGFYEYS